MALKINGKLLPPVEDSGWLEPTMNSGFTSGALASSGNLMYRRIGKFVYIKGSVKGFTASAQACCQLPVGFRPSTRIDLQLGRGGSYFASGSIGGSGNVSLLKDTQGYSADYWYAFCGSWITDEDFPNN